MKRNHNEDSFLVMPEEQLYCVADGMGGHFAGEIASKIAIDELAEFFRLTSRGLGRHPAVQDGARRGTTTRTGWPPASSRPTPASSRPPAAIPTYRGWAPPSPRCTSPRGRSTYGHVGDSRSLPLPRRQAVADDRGPLAAQRLPEGARSSRPRRSRPSPTQERTIVRALGMKDTVQVRRRPERASGWRHVPALLRRAVGDGERRARMEADPRPARSELEEACGKLIELANAAGGNATTSPASWRATGSA